MSDPASLQNLHDIVVPAPVAWWPPAPGWYVLAALGAATLLVLAWRGWKSWRRNRYRRQALRELTRIRKGETGAELRQVPELLKRAALSAWPRESVASLVGPDWHRFLDETGGTDCFQFRMGPMLDRLAYAGDARETPPASESDAVLAAARDWLKQHRAPWRDG